MRKVKLKCGEIEVYDSIEELPIKRFHKYNKMLLIDSGIGSDLTAFDKHISRILVYLKKGQNDLISQELTNLRQGIYFIQSEINPRLLAFSALVASIDGKPCDDISDDGLKRTASILSDATVKEVADTMDEAKKKIDNELEHYFPAIFDDATIKEFYDELKCRTIAILDSIIHGTDNDTEIERITDGLITYSKPKSFGGSDNAEIAYDKQFEKMCLMLSQHLHIRP